MGCNGPELEASYQVCGARRGSIASAGRGRAGGEYFDGDATGERRTRQGLEGQVIPSGKGNQSVRCNEASAARDQLFGRIEHVEVGADTTVRISAAKSAGVGRIDIRIGFVQVGKIPELIDP